MSSGLTYASDKGVLVSLVNDGKDAESIDSNYYSVVENAADGCELEIIFSDVTEINGVVGGSTIVVEYYATLNSNAVIGSAGNENTMHVQYSNNPNSDQEGSTGNTPDDKVVVYTYKLGINKVDSANQPLKGAGFTLSKKNASGTWVKVEVNKNTGVVDDGKSTEKTNIVTELKGDNQTTFEWKGLADGFYKIEETTTPNGYNTIEPIYFTIAAKHDELSDDPQLTELTGTQVDSNGGALSTSTATFTVVTSSVIVNDKTVTTPTGTLTTNVVNEQGIVLPSTGGTGVKVLYTVGAILVLGAAILLITRRRMSMN
jgi:LPXTG-motif cell wall-anchored protein